MLHHFLKAEGKFYSDMNVETILFLLKKASRAVVL